MNVPARFLSWCAVCALVWTAGCGGRSGDADREPTIPVSGTVTYNGNPVEGARVMLMPDTPPGQMATRRGAYAQTDSSGQFELMTFEAGDGAIAGTYKITVTKFEGQEIGEELSDEEYDETPEDEEPPQARNLLPDQYSNIRTTPLEVTIAEGQEPLDLVLED